MQTPSSSWMIQDLCTGYDGQTGPAVEAMAGLPGGFGGWHGPSPPGSAGCREALAHRHRAKPNQPMSAGLGLGPGGTDNGPEDRPEADF